MKVFCVVALVLATIACAWIAVNLVESSLGGKSEKSSRDDPIISTADEHPKPRLNFLYETNRSLSKTECKDAGLGVICECFDGQFFLQPCLEDVMERHIKAWLKFHPAKKSNQTMPPAQ